MFQKSTIKKIVTYSLAIPLYLYGSAVFCEDRFYVIWRDIKLSDAVRLVSQYSGRAIHLTPELRTTISLASTDPLSPDEIFSLFEKSLRERGLTLARIDGNVYQIGIAESNPIPEYVRGVVESESRFNDQSAKIILQYANKSCVDIHIINNTKNPTQATLF